MDLRALPLLFVASLLAACGPRLSSGDNTGGVVSASFPPRWTESVRAQNQEAIQIAETHCRSVGLPMSFNSGRITGADTGGVDGIVDTWRFRCGTTAVPHTAARQTATFQGSTSLAEADRQRAIEAARADAERDRREQQNLRLMELGLGMMAGSRPAQPQPSSTRTYNINGRFFTCTTSGAFTDCF